MSATSLVVLGFLNLLVPTVCWSCLLQRDASFHEGYRGAKPCDQEAHPSGVRAHKTDVAVLTQQRRHQNAPAAPAAAPPAAAPATLQGAPPAKVPEKKVDLAAALRSELRLPISIREIHDSPQGPLSHFLASVHTEFCKALNVEPKRLSILGIRGEYVKLESMLLDEKVVESSEGSKGLNLSVGFVDATAAAASDPHAHEEVQPSHEAQKAAPTDEDKKSESAKGLQADHEVIVDLEMLPGSKAADPSPQTLFDSLKGLLATSGSALTSGPLAAMLQGGSLHLGAKPTGQDADGQTAHEKGAAANWVPSSLLVLALAFVI